MQEFLRRQEASPTSAARYVRKYELLDLKSGERVLDLGCGNGADVVRMSHLVGPQGEVVGVDLNPAMVEATAARASAAQMSNVKAALGDAARLDFPDGSFDAAHTERVLIHSPNPGEAVRELVRVLRPGGRLVCLELDNQTRFADLEDMELHDRVYLHGTGGGNRVGRQLLRLFKRAGLAVTNIEGFVNVTEDGVSQTVLEWDIEQALAQNLITPNEAVRFREMHAAGAAAGEMFAAGISFLVKGVKPAA